MNFSVTGEPAQGGVDAKRKQLIQGLLGSRPGAQRLLGQHTGGGGFSRGYTASDGPTAALPGLTFNPFLAQVQRGQRVDAPTSEVRQSVDDMTGAAQGAQGAPGLQGAPVSDGSGVVGAPPPNANAPGLAQLMAGQPQANPEAGIRWLYGNQPLPQAPPQDYYGGAQPNPLFARGGRNIAS